MKSTSLTTRKLVFAAVALALGMVLPFLTGQIPAIGSMLLPMHIPVLLAGFVCGGPLGMAVGFILPLLRSLTLTMPPLYPAAVAMAFEMAAYGLLTGVLYKLLPKKPVFLYVNLIVSMLLGRLVWGAARLILFWISGGSFTWQIFLAGAFLNAWPGILLQLIIIPPLVVALTRARLISDD
ncbi:MAG: ECF transporter S component [Saccharofermentanales bacterium]|jgi:thiamine transporter ThiT